MISNYLKIAFRNLLKYRFISFINLFGLTVGLTCCFLILTYILHELSYDKYHKEPENIYRVTRSFRNPETGAPSLNLGTIAPPFGPLLQNDFKEIRTITRLLPNGTTPMRYEDKMFNEQNVYFADEHLFDVFTVDVIKGNPQKALTDPFCVMLSETVAKKYFGKDEPLNKMIRIDNNINLKVTGVFKSFPANTHIHPEIMVSFNTLKDSTIYGEQALRTNWGNNSFFTYLLMPPNFRPETMEAQFPAFLNRHMPQNPESKFKTSDWTALALQKVTDIHLRSHTDFEAEENGDIKRVYVFSAIALFILLIACINYMNLSTARSALRAREIGVRKVVGAQRKEIIAQFLSESILVSYMALILAFALTSVSLPWLNQLSGQTLSTSILLRWEVLVPILLVPFVVGVLSGIYPALFMSSFRPVMVLKGLFKAGGGNISFRQVLVTLQFAISIILIISTAVVFKQLRYMQQKSLGFDREHVVTLPYNTGLGERYEAFRNELLANSNVKDAGRSSRIPTGRLLDAMGSQIDRGDSLAPTNADIKYVSADHDFVTTYGVKIVAGRNFSRDFSTDTGSFLLNEAAVKVLGLKGNEEVIGKNFQYGNRRGKIIGVFNDFHFESMHQKIVPLVLLVPRSQSNFGNLSIKVSGNNIPAALGHIESTWKKFLPEVPYQYTFLDENFDRLYQAEQRQGTIFTVFACIAIFIACLGLFGLSAFAITQRIKEIGIRKVLGADVSTIVALLSKDFLKLVAIAAVIAFPVAWYAMNNWLEDFAYRINIPVWIFVVAGILAALVALATISFQAIKAALANPVKSLRTE
ncbi:MAG TPA: ABC transporter permease [Chitinophagaceae bacterium]|nr:ABC transporter permease [Chitinophagaceae bacterium]